MTEYVTYFDEIKPHEANGQHRYMVGGLAVPIIYVSTLEAAVSALATKYFGSARLKPETEFHAAHAYSGKSHFQGRDIDERLAMLVDLAKIIVSNAEVKRVYALVHTDRLYSNTDPAKAAFAFFCEKVQALVGNSGTTLLIGDLDDKQSKAMINDYSEYRSEGKTPWNYGVPIPSIIDCVHFAASHHSRLIQLADAYLFLHAHRWGTRSGYPAKQLKKLLEENNIELWAHKFKEWPPEQAVGV